MIRNFGNVSGLINQPQGLDVGIPAGGAFIRSIQRGTATLALANPVSVPIASVDLTKAVVYITSIGDTVNSSYGPVKGKLISATNLQLSRATASQTILTKVSWEVIEFENVKSLQTGEYTLTTATATVTVTAVDPSKSMLICSWESTASTSGANYSALIYTLTNATTITFDIYKASYQGRNIHWQLIEFP